MLLRYLFEIVETLHTFIFLQNTFCSITTHAHMDTVSILYLKYIFKIKYIKVKCNHNLFKKGMYVQKIKLSRINMYRITLWFKLINATK